MPPITTIQQLYTRFQRGQQGSTLATPQRDELRSSKRSNRGLIKEFTSECIDGERNSEESSLRASEPKKRLRFSSGHQDCDGTAAYNEGEQKTMLRHSSTARLRIARGRGLNTGSPSQGDTHEQHTSRSRSPTPPSKQRSPRKLGHASLLSPVFEQRRSPRKYGAALSLSPEFERNDQMISVSQRRLSRGAEALTSRHHTSEVAQRLTLSPAG